MRLQRLAAISTTVFIGLLAIFLVSGVWYHRAYAPLEYTFTIPQSEPTVEKTATGEYQLSGVASDRWRQFVAAITGDSPLLSPDFPEFIGAYPYGSSGSLIFRFRYPLNIAEVTITDQHTQWGDGDRVRMWMSADGQNWILRYDDQERSQVIDYQASHRRQFQGKKEIYVRYDFYAGDPSRAPNDNRGAALRAFHLRVTLANRSLVWLVNVCRHGILPLSGSIAFLAGAGLLFGFPAKRREMLILLIILALGLGLRLGFVLGLKPAPVAGDSAFYNGQATAVLSYLRAPRDVEHGLRILKGFSKNGPLYPLYLAGIYLIYGDENTQAVRLVQAVTDVLTSAFVFWIGAHVFHAGVGLIAAFLYAIYPSFWVCVGMLQQETISLFFITLTVLVLLVVTEQKRFIGFVGAGGCIGVMVLSRYALQNLLLPLILLIMFSLWLRRERWPIIIKNFGGVLLGVAVTFGLWSGVISLIFHEVIPGSIGGGMIYAPMYYSFARDNGGWWVPYQTFDPEQDTTLAAIVQANGRTAPTAQDYRNTYLKEMFGKPVKFGLFAINKLYYYWKNPYNDYTQLLIGTARQQQRFHQAVVLLGVCGIPFVLLRWRKSLFVLLPVAYCTLVGLLMVILQRAFIHAMPFLMVSGAALLFALRSHLQSRRCWGLVCGSVLALALWNVELLPLMLAGFPGMSTATAHRIDVVGRNLLLIPLMALTYALLGSQIKARWQQFLLSVLPAAIIGFVFTVHVLYSYEWHGWTVRLDKAGMAVRQTITLPDQPVYSPKAYIKIDMAAGGQGSYQVRVTLNGVELKRYTPELESDPEFIEYTQKTYMFRQILSAQGKTYRDMRQWYSIPFDLQMIQPGQPIEIQIQFEKPADSSAYLDLYGDFQVAGKMMALPALSLYSDKNSWEKYYEDGDYRLWTIGPEQGKMSVTDSPRRWTRMRDNATLHSQLLRENAWTDHDLSFQRGIQSGTYRIRLVLEDSEGNFSIF